MIKIECDVRVDGNRRKCRWELTAEDFNEAVRMHKDHLKRQHNIATD